MEIARLSQLQSALDPRMEDARMDIDPEHRNPYPDPEQREPSYPSPEQRGYPEHDHQDSPATPSGVFRPDGGPGLSQNREAVRVRARKQALIGPAKEFENARGNMATTISRRRTALKATDQYMEASEEHKLFLLQEARNAVEQEFREKNRHPEQVAERLGLPMPPKLGSGRPSLNDPRGRPRIHKDSRRPEPRFTPRQQGSDVMDISQQLNHDGEEDGEDGRDGQHDDSTRFSPIRSLRRKGRAERITDLENKLRQDENRIRQLEQSLEAEKAKTAKFETRLARIEVVFNPRLLRTNEATLATLEQRNVMANGAALNPAS